MLMHVAARRRAVCFSPYNSSRSTERAYSLICKVWECMFIAGFYFASHREVGGESKKSANFIA